MSDAAVMSPVPPPLFFSRKFQLAWTRAEKRTRPSATAVTAGAAAGSRDREDLPGRGPPGEGGRRSSRSPRRARSCGCSGRDGRRRSEEHTSELRHTEIYPLSLHGALAISSAGNPTSRGRGPKRGRGRAQRPSRPEQPQDLEIERIFRGEAPLAKEAADHHGPRVERDPAAAPAVTAVADRKSTRLNSVTPRSTLFPYTAPSRSLQQEIPRRVDEGRKEDEAERNGRPGRSSRRISR